MDTGSGLLAEWEVDRDGEQAYVRADRTRAVEALAQAVRRLPTGTRRSTSQRARGAAAAVLLGCAATLAAAGEEPPSETDYRLGGGLRLPSLDLTLGGYATVSYDRRQDRSARGAIDDASLSAWWEPGNRWKVFAEFDYQNALSTRSTDADDEARYLALERSYIDYAVDERTSVRLGKFLTPIGRWNLIHATPLVWTTSRPLVTTDAFPTNMTGLMVSGTVSVAEHAVDYSVYGSNGNEFRPNPDVDTFREAVGARVVASLSHGAQLGLSYVNFEQSKTQEVRKQLYGVDFFWTAKRYEVWAEGVYRVLRRPGIRNDGGGFVQLVAPIPVGERLFAVVRFEGLRDSQQSRPITLWVTGLSYRLTPAVVFKAEWVSSQHNTIGVAEGFLSSVSVLF